MCNQQAYRSNVNRKNVTFLGILLEQWFLVKFMPEKTEVIHSRVPVKTGKIIRKLAAELGWSIGKTAGFILAVIVTDEAKLDIVRRSEVDDEG